jgi:predicted nucleotidyltransferase
MRETPTVDALRAALKPLWDSGRFRLIVLFGSTATGERRPDSDLDLAFLPVDDEPVDAFDEIALNADVVRLTHENDVDVVDLRRADPLAAMEVARSGIPLYSEDSTVFPEFRSLAFRRYVDTEKLRTAQRRALDLFQERHEPS